MRSIGERSSKAPDLLTIIQPKPASQQRSWKPRKEALNVGAILDRDIDVKVAGAGQLLAGIGARKAGAGRPALDARHAFELRQYGHQRLPDAAGLLDLGRDRVRHALGIGVEQGERRLSFTVDYVIRGAGDDIDGAVLQLRLGDDLDLVGQARPQRAEHDGLVRFQLPISAASSHVPAIGARRAVPLAIRQALPSLLTAPSSASEMRLVSRPPARRS